MSDLISREALFERLAEWNRNDATDKSLFNFAMNRIIEQPTVEAVPVVHGKWFGNTCSACGLNWNENMVNNADDWGYFEPMPNFCPNCGADMRTSAE